MRTISKPPASAGPFTAAMSGLGNLRVTMPPKPPRFVASSPPLPFATFLRSAPAQNVEPGAGEDDDRDRVVGLEVVEDRFHRLGELAVHRVARLGPVEGDDRHPVASFDLDYRHALVLSEVARGTGSAYRASRGSRSHPEAKPSSGAAGASSAEAKLRPEQPGEQQQREHEHRRAGGRRRAGRSRRRSRPGARRRAGRASRAGPAARSAPGRAPPRARGAGRCS